MFRKRLFNGTARIVRDNYSNATTKWWDIRKEVFERDSGKCQVFKGWSKCGKPAKEVHHVTPLSRGGTTTKTNLISICKDCHDARHPGHDKRK